MTTMETGKMCKDAVRDPSAYDKPAGNAQESFLSRQKVLDILKSVKAAGRTGTDIEDKVRGIKSKKEASTSSSETQSLEAVGNGAHFLKNSSKNLSNRANGKIVSYDSSSPSSRSATASISRESNFNSSTSSKEYRRLREKTRSPSSSASRTRSRRRSRSRSRIRRRSRPRHRSLSRQKCTSWSRERNSPRARRKSRSRSRQRSRTRKRYRSWSRQRSRSRSRRRSGSRSRNSRKSRYKRRTRSRSQNDRSNTANKRVQKSRSTSRENEKDFRLTKRISRRVEEDLTSHDARKLQNHVSSPSYSKEQKGVTSLEIQFKTLVRSKRSSSSSSSSSSTRSRSSSRGRRRYRYSSSPTTSTSRSSSHSPENKMSHNQLRHISPPSFSLGNVPRSPALSQRTRLRVRSLSPVSMDTVSRTVDNAWNFYYNRYYSQSSITSDGSVLDAQLTFLESYSGYFVKSSNFENFYDRLIKPEDLKQVLSARLRRLSPGPTIDEMIPTAEWHPMNPQSFRDIKSLRQSIVNADADHSPKKHAHSAATNSTKENLPMDTARSMSDLIKAGAIPGLSLCEEGTDPSDKPKLDASPSSPSSQSRTSTSEDKQIRLGIGSSSFSSQGYPTPIPFLNDGTLDELSNIPGKDVVVDGGVGGRSKIDVDSKSIDSSKFSFAKPKSSIGNKSSIVNSIASEQCTDTNVLPLGKSEGFNAASGMTETDKDRHPTLPSPNSPTALPLASIADKQESHMPVFIIEVMKGIIRMAALHANKKLSPDELKSETERESNLMHALMISPAGHCLIKMAMCQLSQPQQLSVQFKHVGLEASELMHRLDVRVVKLIAGTPFLHE